MKSEKRETMEKNDLVGFWFEYKRWASFIEICILLDQVASE